MSFEIEADGEVKYHCRGCDAKATMRSLKSLPKGWCLTGVLAIAQDPELESEEQGQQKLKEAGALIGAHFHSSKCGKKFLAQTEVKDQILAAGITLALWSKVEIVIDGAKMKEPTEMSEDGTYRGTPPPFETDVGGAF